VARDVWQTISDALQIPLDALQITLDALQIGESILEGRLQLVRASRLVLRAVRDDGTGGEIGALIGIPYRRLLYEADGVCEVGLVRQEIADCVPMGGRVFVAGNGHAFMFQRLDERAVDDLKRRSV